MASTDLSHFHAYDRPKNLDKKVLDRVAAFDERGLMPGPADRPVEACGGGIMVTVMKTARLLGASHSRVLRYANSGDVTGDRSGVVGYLAAALFKNDRAAGNDPEPREAEGFTREEKAFLHPWPAGTIEHRLTGKPLPSLEGETTRN